jgi:hypothetical protein
MMQDMIMNSGTMWGMGLVGLLVILLLALGMVALANYLNSVMKVIRRYL